MIEIKDLKKTYRNRRDSVEALKGVSFTLGESGIVFLYGESGQGKSTLLNILAGLEPYDVGGEVKYNGKDILTMPQKERDVYRSKEIGLIFEKSNLIDTLTVRENIELAVNLSGYKATEEEIKRVLKQVKLEGYEYRRIAELSNGEAQRVSIAKVLLLRPRVLLVDEPTASLDSENAETFWKVVKDFSKTSLVVAITHNKAIVDKYADRVIELKEGRIVKDKTIKEQPKIEPKEEVARTRSYLSSKTNFKLGTKFLTKNTYKFVSMLILTVLTLMMFSIGYLASNFDRTHVLAKSTLSQGMTYVAYENSGKEITLTDLEDIHDSGMQSTYYRLYRSNMSIAFTNDSSMDILGIMEVGAKNEKENTIGQGIIEEGKYPTNLDSANKIAISDYMAAQMMLNRTTYYTLEEGEEQGDVFINETTKEIDVKKVQNKWYNISGKRYKVVAIYKTNYKDYVDIDYTNKKMTVKEGEEANYNYYLENVYSIIHVAPSKAAELIANRDSEDRVALKISVANGNYLDTHQDVTSQSKVTAIDYMLTQGKTTINKSEVVLPIDLFNKLFGGKVTEEEIDNQDRTEYNNSIEENNKIEISTAYGYRIKYNVVGVTKGEEIIFSNNQDSTEGRVGEVIQHGVYPIKKIVVPVGNIKELADHIKRLEEQGLTYTGRYAEEIMDATKTMENLKIGIVVSTVVLGLFSIYMIFTFFMDMGSSNKETIGSLRTMGANSINIFGIFLISCLIIALTGIILGPSIGAIGSVILNEAIAKSFGLPIKVMTVRFGMFGYTSLMGIIITLIGSVIPVAIYCKKSPVQVIKNK